MALLPGALEGVACVSRRHQGPKPESEGAVMKVTVSSPNLGLMMTSLPDVNAAEVGELSAEEEAFYELVGRVAAHAVQATRLFGRGVSVLIEFEPEVRS